MSRFLAPYNAYAQKLTDAPLEYSEAAGLSLVSTICLGRRWLSSDLHPNLYILLMADSSRDRKSTSVKQAVKLLREVDEKRMGPDDFTGEGLLKYMGRPKMGASRNKLLIPIEEFGTTLATRSAYGETMTPILCKLYDGSDFTRVRAGQPTLTVERPRLTILGGCAYAFLEQYGSPHDWVNGFYARCLFVTPQTKRPAYQKKPKENKVDFDLMRMALTDLVEDVKARPGTMDLLPDADALFSTFADSIPPNEGDITWTAQRERLLTSTQKLALIFQVDLEPSTKLIGAEAMQRATAFAAKAWAAFEVAYARSTDTPRGRICVKVWKFLSDNAKAFPYGMSGRQIYRQLHIGVEDFANASKVLIQQGAIAVLQNSDMLRYVCREPYE